MDHDKPGGKKAESSAAKPAKKAGKKAPAKATKKTATPPAPTADFPAATPSELADASPATSAEATPEPNARSGIVKETEPTPPVAAAPPQDEDSADFVARHRAEDEATDAEMVSLIQSPMRTPTPSRAPIVIGAMVLLVLRRRRRRRRARKRVAAGD